MKMTVEGIYDAEIRIHMIVCVCVCTVSLWLGNGSYLAFSLSSCQAHDQWCMSVCICVVWQYSLSSTVSRRRLQENERDRKRQL